MLVIRFNKMRYGGAHLPVGPKTALTFRIREFTNNKIVLAHCVSNVYTTAMTKDSGLRIRVEKELRERFLALCKKQDRPAAQVLREFMRGYLDEHEPTNQSTSAETRQTKGHQK